MTPEELDATLVTLRDDSAGEGRGVRRLASALLETRREIETERQAWAQMFAEVTKRVNAMECGA